MANLANASLELLRRRNGESTNNHSPTRVQARNPSKSVVRIVQATKAQRQISHPDTISRSLTTIVRGLARRTDPPVGVGTPLQQSPVTNYVQITGNGLSSTSGSSASSSSESSSSSPTLTMATSASTAPGWQPMVSGGAAAGIAVGCIVAVAMLVCLALYYWRRGKQAAAGDGEDEFPSCATDDSPTYVHSERRNLESFDKTRVDTGDTLAPHLLPEFPASPEEASKAWQSQAPPPSELPTSVTASPNELPATMGAKPTELPSNTADIVKNPVSKDENL